MKPIYIHSGMVGAPQYANANDSINGILEACLVNGFNSRTATSASASGGVLTLNFGADPGFEALQTVEVAVSSVALVNGQHRVIANTNNQVTIAIAGLPDGAVGSSGAGITIKQAGAGWSKLYSDSTAAVFRPPAGNRRYLRCAHALNTNFSARGYEEMTGLDAGIGAFPSTTQDAAAAAIMNYSNGLPAAAPWFVIVTDSWVILTLIRVAGGTALKPFIFGDVSAEKTVAGDLYATCIVVNQGRWLARNHAGATGGVLFSFDAGALASATWPSVISDGFRLLPYVTMQQNTDNVLRGVFPNAYKMMPSAPASAYSAIYDNVAGVTGRVKTVQLTGNDGAVYNTAIAIDEEVWL